MPTIESNNFTRWFAQSTSGRMGRHKTMFGLSFGDNATHEARVADRAIRINAKEDLDRVFEMIHSMAKRGQFMTAIQVSSTQVKRVVSKLKSKKYVIAYNDKPIPGSKIYSEMAICWANESRKLLHDKRYQNVAYNLYAVFLTESLAHGMIKFEGLDNFRFIAERSLDAQITREQMLSIMIPLVATQMNRKIEDESMMNWANHKMIPYNTMRSGICKVFKLNPNDFDKVFTQYMKEFGLKYMNNQKDRILNTLVDLYQSS